LMKRHDARILEVPIDWAEVGGSKITPGLDTLRMLWGLTRLKQRLAHLPEDEQESRFKSTLLSAP